MNTTTLPAGQSYLVTGGTGYAGQAIIRFILDHLSPRRVLCFSRDEWKQAEQSQLNPDPRMRWVLGDVRDRDRLENVLPGVDVVIHAAALKRVDSIAYNPTEVNATNIVGTKNVCMAAISSGVGKIVTISSDKAVQPTNTYGCSKQMAEHLTVGANVWGYPQGVKLACVRYGNVLGSRGSVVGIFRQQVAQGLPFQITDPRMSRFWITIQGACELIHMALQRMEGGEIFLPKIKAATIPDLAHAIATAHPHKETGLRPGGEKLAEVMLSGEEVSRTFDRGDHYIITPNPHPWRAEGWSGTLVPEGFEYRSDTAERLDIGELRAMLKDVP